MQLQDQIHYRELFQDFLRESSGIRACIYLHQVMEAVRMPGGKKVYSKRYPPAPETMEIIHTQQSAEERATTKKSFDEFLQPYRDRKHLRPDTRTIDRGKHFVALAIELSQKYEIDIDIWQKSYFIEVNLHLFCSSYPSELTRYHCGTIHFM